MHTDDERREGARARTRLIYDGVAAALPGSAIAALALSWAIATGAADAAFRAWIALVVVILGARAADLALHRRGARAGSTACAVDSSGAARRRTSAGALAAAIGWSVALGPLWPNDQGAHQAMVVLVLGAVAGGSLVTLAHDRRLGALVQLGLFAGVQTRLAVEMGPHAVELAWFAALAFGAPIAFARRMGNGAVARLEIGDRGDDEHESGTRRGIEVVGATRPGRRTGRATSPERRLAAARDRALERDGLELCYQPRVDVRTGRACAFEAVVGRRGRAGDAPRRIDQWVGGDERILEAVCAQQALWRAQGQHVRVSLDIGADALVVPGGVDALMGPVRCYGLDGGALELELQATPDLGQGSTSYRDACRDLRALGVRLALDDFGAGYASLAALGALEIDALKIGPMFVDVASDGSGPAIAMEQIGQIAAGLGLELVGVGARTAEQLERARGAGCRAVQGDVHGGPLEASAVFELVAGGRLLGRPAAPDGRVVWLDQARRARRRPRRVDPDPTTRRVVRRLDHVQRR